MNYPANRKLLKTLETSKEQIKELINNDIDYDSNNEFISNYSALTELLENIDRVIYILKGLQPSLSDYQRSQLPDDDDRKHNL